MGVVTDRRSPEDRRQHDARVERRLIVVGRVQGVGYRWFARQAAVTLGVVGWTRNMPDGTVVLEVAAAQEVLEQFIAELRVGPPAAKVQVVRMVERESTDSLPEQFVVLG
jgi:acylphosphatase